MYAETDLVFKQVMLGPVHTGIYTMADRLPGWMVRIKSLSSASLDDTVRAISGFAATRKRKLIYPWRALPAFGAMWLGQRLVPGFLQGRKTLDGRPRRRQPSADRDPRALGESGRVGAGVISRRTGGGFHDNGGFGCDNHLRPPISSPLEGAPSMKVQSAFLGDHRSIRNDFRGL